MNEEMILRKMRQGSPEGLEALMKCFIPYVSAIVWNILRDTMSREDAEEVVSDVFLAAWEQSEDIRPGCARAWLGAVARNKAKNKLRSMGRDLPLEEDALELPDSDSLQESLERKEAEVWLRRAIDNLGEPDSEVFLRHYYFAQTVSEISQYMHINESTVKTKLRRGRMRLKERLTRWDVL